MSSEYLIEFVDVWKKYAMHHLHHRSLREDIVSIFKKDSGETLKNTEFWALQRINLSVRRGECIGLYGPNGSGKSTILKIIAAVTRPSRGDVTVRGRVAPLIELGAGFHPDLSGRENIYLNGAIVGMSLKEIKNKIDEIIEFSELSDFIEMPVKKYSSGMYLRLGFSVAVHSSADILLMDEILAVGDARFQKKCLDKIRQLKPNRCMVLVSHSLQMLSDFADAIIYIEKGQIKEG